MQSNNFLSLKPVPGGSRLAFKWFWQSDQDPFAEKDPQKWTWTPYPDDHSYKIEDGRLSCESVIDLGEYEVDLKRMCQINKKERHRIRRVKMELNASYQSRFVSDLPVPTSIDKYQKSINPAFGTVQHFLNYIMKRTREAFKLFQKLRDLDLDSQQDQYEDIVQGVMNCIKEGAKTREKVVKTRMSLNPFNFIAEGEEIVNLIVSESRDLRGFLKIILRIYTKESFICYWLNELLRSEDWEEINILTPYLVCLAYTFQLPSFVIKHEEPKGLSWALNLINVKPKILLYRGTALTDDHRRLYDPEKNRYFSWNGVTSTSRSRSQAVKFVKLSMNKAQMLGEAKKGVLFQIEAEFGSVQDCEGMIDISEDSEYPQEQEIILAPGTVFEITRVQFLQEGFYKVNLVVRKKFEEDQKQVSLLGALQQRVILNDRALFDGLSADQLIKCLNLLEGNQLVQKLDIRNITLDSHLVNLINDMIKTTFIMKENIRLMNNRIYIQDFEDLYRYFSLKNFNQVLEILGNNTLELAGDRDHGEDGENMQEVSKGDLVTKVSLKRQALRKFCQESQLEKLLFYIEREVDIADLNIEMKDLDIPTNVISRLFSRLSLLPKLTSIHIDLSSKHSQWDQLITCLQEIQKTLATLKRLFLNFKECLNFSNESLSQFGSRVLLALPLQGLQLDFTRCDKISNEGLISLGKSISSLSSLQELQLDFTRCDKISDEGLISLGKSISPLSSLQQLSLNFAESCQISDRGLGSLSKSLASIPTLELISLNFDKCNQISEKGLSSLSMNIRPLLSLHHLSLNFKRCNQISDEGLKPLSVSIFSLPSLQHLSLNFAMCKKISDEGLAYAIQFICLRETLQHLSLDFHECHYPKKGVELLSLLLAQLKALQSLDLYLQLGLDPDKTLNNLSKSLVPLQALRHLSLDFMRYSFASDKALKALSKSLASLVLLQHLSLNFGSWSEISDTGLSNLISALIFLVSLQHLSLNFEFCKKISDEVPKNLGNALASLTHLQHLSLDFSFCEQISDVALKSLSISLAPLHHLSLRFSACKKLTNEGLESLRRGFTALSSLEHLSLDFSFCENISLGGLKHLGDILILLPNLRHLSLDFKDCQKLSDKELRSFKNSLSSLYFLQHLSLDFSGCTQMPDQALKSLSESLASLPSLQHLYLSFARCKKISNEALKSLRNGLTGLPSLHFLSLDFHGCEKISDDGVMNLSKGIASLHSLGHLSLNHSFCSSISNKALKNLSESLISLPSLYYLALIFNSCKSIANEALKSLSKSFTSLPYLKHLNLHFGHYGLRSVLPPPPIDDYIVYEIMSDIGLLSLGESLTSLLSLQSLDLNFDSCFKISNEGIKSLSKGLSLLPNLRILELNVRSCYKISDEGLKSVENSITSARSLEDLTLIFSDCDKISEEAKKSMNSALKSLPCLLRSSFLCDERH